MPCIPYAEHVPTVAPDVFIAPDAWVIGRVTLEAQVSVFFGAVLRGDIEPILIGCGSNIQEHATLHTTGGFPPVTVGHNVTIGHRATLHSCEIQDGCIIGMGATVLDGAIIGRDCMIGAHTLIPMRAQIPPGSMVYGSPGRVVRPLKEKELEWLRESANHYIEKGRWYRDYFITHAAVGAPRA